ncbi:MAG: hypothetical protein AAB074_03275 [Planctomycetota bacterium]
MPTPQSSRKRVSWTAALVVNEIRKLRERRISPSQSYVVGNHPALYGAAQRLLGGWRNALIAAGEEPAKVARESRDVSNATRTKWTHDFIIKTLQERARLGKPLNFLKMRDSGFGGFLRAAARVFGSYEAAIRAAGLSYASIKRGTDWVSNPEKAIIGGIRELASAKVELNISSAQHHRSGLVTAAITHFGSWDSALVAAGFDPINTRLDLDTEAGKGRIFQNLCYDLFQVLRPKWRDDHRCKTTTGVLLPDAYDPDTREWIDFKIAAWGMSVQKSIRKYSGYADHLRLICLAGRRNSTERVTFESIFDYEGEAMTPTLRTLFERMRCLAAHDVPTTSFEEWATRWTRREVIQTIQNLPPDERHSRHAQLHNKGAYSAAVRMFGGWYAAVEASGFDVEDVRRRRPAYTKGDVDAFISGRSSSGLGLSARVATATASGSGLYQAASRFYDNWAAALAANGLKYDDVKLKPGRERFTKQVLDRFIRTRHNARERLNATTVRDQFKGEYGAAFRIYGGWRQAVEANGISYRSVSEIVPPRRVTQTEVDAYIRSRSQTGLPLNSRAVCRDDRPIHTAACRRFYGSWSNALKVNGIDYDTVTLRRRRNPRSPG